MSKHTPGPWTAVERELGFLEVDGGPERRLWSVQAEGRNIVGLTIYSRDEPDARLIAAAPDMLDALECLLPGLVLDLRYASYDDDKNAMRSRIKTVTDALDKALGAS